jgi:general secretion pathway protein G
MMMHATHKVLSTVGRWFAAHGRLARGVRAAERGMTLVEIMVVVIIIGLVTSVVGVSVFGQLEKAKRSTAFTQIKQLSEGLELYKLSYHNYPTTGEGLAALASPKGGGAPIMKEIPKDPWDHDYVYIYPGANNQGSFDLMSYGADGVQGGGDDVANYKTGNSEGQ